MQCVIIMSFKHAVPKFLNFQLKAKWRQKAAKGRSHAKKSNEQAKSGEEKGRVEDGNESSCLSIAGATDESTKTKTKHKLKSADFRLLYTVNTCVSLCTYVYIGYMYT